MKFKVLLCLGAASIGFGAGYILAHANVSRDDALLSLMFNISSATAMTRVAHSPPTEMGQVSKDLAQSQLEMAVLNLNIAYGTHWELDDIVKQCGQPNNQCNEYERKIASAAIKR